MGLLDLYVSASQNNTIPFFDTPNDPTSYPSTTNHTSEIRGYFAEPSEPPEKYDQKYGPSNTYLNFIKDYI
jgi:hypothetical protein